MNCVKPHRRSMTFGLLCLLASPASAQPGSPVSPAPVGAGGLARLGWLAGCWELKTARRTTLEMWMPPDGGMMLGASRTIAAGAVREFEQLRIETQRDTVVYTSIPSGQTVTSFKAVQLTDSSFIVENLAHDFPQRILYRRLGTDSLLARIEGPGPSGLRGVDFPMRRVNCAEPPPTGLSARRFEPRELSGLRWWKGNTHSHTTESDGDSPPEVVVRWYKSHGYSFLVLSDHNVFTDPARLTGLVDSTFLLVGGEELTTQFGSKPVHINGLALTQLVPQRIDSTLVGTIQRNVDAIREVAGIPHINHPNFRWSFGLQELLQVRNDSLLEIFNGHPQVHNDGGDEGLGVEAIWDGLLSAGKRIYGIAVDDAHHFQGEFARNRANPGRGWISIAAQTLEARQLMRNLEHGLFYASSGVTVADISVTGTTLALRIQPEADFKYTTTFIGDHGRALAQVGGLAPVFSLDRSRARGLSYVRARVEDSGGARAWIQPVFLQPN